MSRIIINGTEIETSGKDIVITENKVIVNGINIAELTKNNNSIKIEGNCDMLSVYGNVEIIGNCTALACSGNAIINGNINGSISCSGNLIHNDK